jgi:hypothetical protein
MAEYYEGRKDVINDDERRRVAKTAIRQMLSIFENAEANGVKPKISDFSPFKQDAKEYYDIFKHKGNEGFEIWWAFAVSLFVAISINFLNFNIHFSFFPREVNQFFNGAIVGALTGGMFAFAKYIWTEDVSETGYVRAMLGHLTRAESKYVEPIRQVLFDGISDNDYRPFEEKFNFKMLLFLWFLIAVFSGVSYLGGRFHQLGLFFVFVVTFVLWFVDFHYKKKKEEDDE